MYTAYLLLGSNVGDRRELLASARSAVTEHIGVIEKASHLFETAPWGLIDQTPFINQALCVNTHLSPKKVLKAIRKIEEAAGRQRSIQWGPRTLDIDILLYDDLIIDTRELTLPHPRMTQRRFSLAPLAEIAGDIVHPTLGLRISELLKQCPDLSEVAILAEG